MAPQPQPLRVPIDPAVLLRGAQGLQRRYQNPARVKDLGLCDQGGDGCSVVLPARQAFQHPQKAMAAIGVGGDFVVLQRPGKVAA